ncbi:MAG: alanine racemase, partial [Oscillospiraceae bacterium]
MDLSCYNSYYEVDLGKIAQNYYKIEKHTGAKVMPVVKANAYGLGMEEVAAFLNKKFDVGIFACAQVFEGVVLRESGITNTDILVMGPALPDALSAVVKYDLQIPAFTPLGVTDLNDAAVAQGKIAKVHIKIETGMNRIGVHGGVELKEL